MLLAHVTQQQLLKPGLIAVVLLLLPVVLHAAPTIEIPRLEAPPTLADFGAMQPDARFSNRMLKVSGFIAREPADGARPTQDTDVYLGYDSHNLYAVFICWDKEPDKIRARMTRREDIFAPCHTSPDLVGFFVPADEHRIKIVAVVCEIHVGILRRLRPVRRLARNEPGDFQHAAADFCIWAHGFEIGQGRWSVNARNLDGWRSGEQCRRQQ